MSETIVTKRCPQCTEIKPLNEFFKNKAKKDGHQCYCKPCRNAATEKYRHTQNGQISLKKYRQSENKKQVYLRYRLNNREKMNTRAVLHYSVKVGKLPHPESLKCFLCDNPAKEYHHHNGYGIEHRLDVIAVCISCHNKI